MISKNYIFGRKYSALDTDVQAFINATGITDTTIISALQYLVPELKNNGLWVRLKAIYPIVGVTAFTHSFNLKDSRNLDSAFRLEINGGWTHSVNGMLPNGSNAFAQTFLVPSTELGVADGHLYFYSRTNSNAGSSYDMGAADDAGVVTKTTALITRYNTDTAYGMYGNGSHAGSITSTDSRGGFMVNRNDSTNTTFWKNGSKIKTTEESVVLTTQQIYIGAINAGGGPNFLSNKECSFSSIGGGFSDSEALIYHNIIQTFQTMLGRQV